MKLTEINVALALQSYSTTSAVLRVIPSIREVVLDVLDDAQLMLANLNSESAALNLANKIVYPAKPSVIEGVLFQATQLVGGVLGSVGTALGSLAGSLLSAAGGGFSNLILAGVGLFLGAKLLMKKKEGGSNVSSSTQLSH